MELPKDFILVNKPAGWTSFDVVGFIRKGMRRTHSIPKKFKIGHAGTLDPFATGLLIVGIGREATKQLDQFKKLPKTYIATITLGEVSDTYDSTGTITQVNSEQPSEETLRKALHTFTGTQEQIPPMHSAKKFEGKRLYVLARQGIEVERKTSAVEIYELKLLTYSYPVATIEVRCSAGTYIRTLAYDIGQKLGTGAYCSALERTAIGDYTVTKAYAPHDVFSHISL